VVPEGVEWIEFAVSEDDAVDLGRVFAGIGFAEAGRHRSKQVTRWRQGEINLVINTEPEGLAHSHQIVHGPSVVALGLRVGDAAAATTRAEALRMVAFRQSVGPGELDIPAIRGLGGSLVYFTDAKGELGRVWDIEFAPTGREAASVLARIDHIAQSMSPDEMLSWRL
jgi:4-hydroxyphenylpyruvate dioxygenase